jgi:hypothetical protein
MDVAKSLIIGMLPFRAGFIPNQSKYCSEKVIYGIAQKVPESTPPPYVIDNLAAKVIDQHYYSFCYLAFDSYRSLIFRTIAAIRCRYLPTFALLLSFLSVWQSFC